MALRARQAKSSLRPPPIRTTAAKAIQTAALGSLSQLRPAPVPGAQRPAGMRPFDRLVRLDWPFRLCPIQIRSHSVAAIVVSRD